MPTHAFSSRLFDIARIKQDNKSTVSPKLQEQITNHKQTAGRYKQSLYQFKKDYKVNIPVYAFLDPLSAPAWVNLDPVPWKEAFPYTTPDEYKEKTMGRHDTGEKIVIWFGSNPGKKTIRLNVRSPVMEYDEKYPSGKYIPGTVGIPNWREYNFLIRMQLLKLPHQNDRLIGEGIDIYLM